MSQRDSYVDIAKGFCILLIICIHAEVFGVIGMPITVIAVPMFFFMSGFYDRTDKPLSQWLIKSLRTLLLPAIIWVVIGYCYSQILTFAKEHTFNPIQFNIFNPCDGNGPAWFLFALLYAKLGVWLLNKIRLSKYFIYPITYIIGYVGSTFQMPLLIDEGLAALPLYYSGKLIYPYLKQFITKYWILIIGIVGLLLFLQHYVYYTIVPIDNGCYKPYYIVGILTIEMVIFGTLYFSAKLKSFPLLENLGKKSLGIMLLHAPMCHTAAVILNRVFEKGTSVWIACFLIAYVLIVALSYYLTIGIERFCPILLGKKR